MMPRKWLMKVGTDSMNKAKYIGRVVVIFFYYYYFFVVAKAFSRAGWFNTRINWISLQKT